jgi:hypothetical protein
VQISLVTEHLTIDGLGLLARAPRSLAALRVALEGSRACEESAARVLTAAVSEATPQ